MDFPPEEYKLQDPISALTAKSKSLRCGVDDIRIEVSDL